MFSDPSSAKIAIAADEDSVPYRPWSSRYMVR
jgi:hypothetical protein